MKNETYVSVKIDKLVHGGQGIGVGPDGRKVFVWNALPGETVIARIIKAKRSYAEAIATEVVVSSNERIAPSEDNYLATSPWQMMAFEAENAYKSVIVDELFAHENVQLPSHAPTIHDDREWGYRNKMEYSFWGDENGLHLAMHQRGSHGKHIIEGSKLAMPEIDSAARAMRDCLNKLNVRAGDLKTLILRASKDGRVVASLFVKVETFASLQLAGDLMGLRVYFSNPKSPASVSTKLIQEVGVCELTDTLLEKTFMYDVDSFFQVNIPVFEKALEDIRQNNQTAHITDMYAGVGSIGLSLPSSYINLVELDPATVAMARRNAEESDVSVSVIEASTETALSYISSDQPIIFDPPRAGLHAKVIDTCLEALPPQITYLSCNPATQARDLALLQSAYNIEAFRIYNFFPRTPHIETLAILHRA